MRTTIFTTTFIAIFCLMNSLTVHASTATTATPSFNPAALTVVYDSVFVTVSGDSTLYKYGIKYYNSSSGYNKILDLNPSLSATRADGKVIVHNVYNGTKLLVKVIPRTVREALKSPPGDNEKIVNKEDAGAPSDTQTTSAINPVQEEAGSIDTQNASLNDSQYAVRDDEDVSGSEEDTLLAREIENADSEFVAIAPATGELTAHQILEATKKRIMNTQGQSLEETMKQLAAVDSSFVIESVLDTTPETRMQKAQKVLSNVKGKVKNEITLLVRTLYSGDPDSVGINKAVRQIQNEQVKALNASLKEIEEYVTQNPPLPDEGAYLNHLNQNVEMNNVNPTYGTSDSEMNTQDKGNDSITNNAVISSRGNEKGDVDSIKKNREEKIYPSNKEIDDKTVGALNTNRWVKLGNQLNQVMISWGWIERYDHIDIKIIFLTLFFALCAVGYGTWWLIQGLRHGFFRRKEEVDEEALPPVVPGKILVIDGCDATVRSKIENFCAQFPQVRVGDPPPDFVFS